MSTRSSIALSLALATAGCTGSIGDAPLRGGSPTGPDRDGDGVPDPDPGDARQSLGRIATHRLTQAELRLTLEDLLGIDVAGEIELIPQDAQEPEMPFDNDAASQTASTALVEGIAAMMEHATGRVLADVTLRDRLVGCTPSGADDAACLTSFVTSFGRRALRRPLDAAEVAAYVSSAQPLATATGDFYRAVRVITRAMLDDVRFVYRVEIGAPVAGVPDLVKLDGFEVASRVSYLLWGSMPDDALLDLAERGALATPEQVRAAAERMIDDPHARARVARFHAMWLGFDRSTGLSADLAPRMRAETDALVERVVFEDRSPWTDLFRFDQTYIDDTLAAHYGLVPSGSTAPRWTSWGATGRRGILSEGIFLSTAARFGDTSPTQRGIAIRKRLFCQEIGPPPPTVNANEPPAATDPDACKAERYEQHRSNESCASCHASIDPIGFGLERYDETGAYREYDDGRPDCAITGDGELAGVGTFNGPAELSELAISSGLLDQCLVTQLFRFTVGRRDRVEDAPSLDALTDRFRSSDHDLRQMLLDLVGSPGFGYRLVDHEGE